MQKIIQIDPRRQFPRRFVPAGADMGTWEDIEPLFRQLLAHSLDTVEQLEQWLLDYSELGAALAEERAKRYVAMTSQTDDPERSAAYRYFVEQIEPKAKPHWQTLEVKYSNSQARPQLPMDRYAVLDRIIENDVALFREENIPLQTQEALLSQEYQKTTGAMTIRYRDTELTLQQAAKYLEEPDRSVRHEVWALTIHRRLQEREKLDALYDHLVALRAQMAKNAGFANYRDYAFRLRRRFDYTPEDCFRFHASIERTVLPVVRVILEDRGRKLGVETLRPWDLQVDPLHRPPLRPFSSADEFVDGVGKVFARVHPELRAQFQFMGEERLFDLESRKGKAPGGYQQTLDERRWPFIFMNAVGRDDDIRTLLHEGGHAFHQLAAREEPLLHYRHAPPEFAEVASMGMELLATPHLDVFYKEPADFRRSYRNALEDGVLVIARVAALDAFQHWIYTHPDHSREERLGAWLEIYGRFTPLVDWRGHEEARAYHWQSVIHLYVYPFYVIEYAMAQVGAFQLWLHSRRDPRGAVEQYWQALSLGGSRRLPELFAAAGAQFRFDDETLSPLMDAVAEELERLGGVDR